MCAACCVKYAFECTVSGTAEDTAVNLTGDDRLLSPDALSVDGPTHGHSSVIIVSSADRSVADDDFKLLAAPAHGDQSPRKAWGDQTFMPGFGPASMTQVCLCVVRAALGPCVTT